MRPKFKGSLYALTLGVLLLAGCGRQFSDFTVETGPTVVETQSVQSLGALAADADVRMGVGRLNIAGGATDLMTGTFTYNVAAWKPEVTYELDESRGMLRVAQPGESSANLPNPASVEYVWDLRFSSWMPLALSVDTGVGAGTLDLRGLNLTDLEVTTGLGTTTIDLGGVWPNSFDVQVRRGVGKTTIIVPSQVGVQLRPRSGVGNVLVYGLTQNGEVYHNSQYGVSPITLDIEVLGALGTTEVRLDQ